MPLVLEVAQVVAPVFLLAAIGFGWVRSGRHYDVEFVTRLAMTLSIPCLIFMALVRSDVDPRLLRDTVLAALVAYLVVGAIAWALVRGLDLDMRDLLGADHLRQHRQPRAADRALRLRAGGVRLRGGDLRGDGDPLLHLRGLGGGGRRQPGDGGARAAGLGDGPRLGLPRPRLGRCRTGSAPRLDLVGQMAIPLMLITLGVAIARLQPRALGPGASGSASPSSRSAPRCRWRSGSPSGCRG